MSLVSYNGYSSVDLLAGACKVELILDLKKNPVYHVVEKVTPAGRQPGGRWSSPMIRASATRRVSYNLHACQCPIGPVADFSV